MKKSFYKNGRGYCGYHITWDNRKVFCRSILEKIQCIFLDREQTYYLMECEIYNINGKTYKPDFFIYDDKYYSNLVSIIEIKDTQKECNLYISEFGAFFDDLGIGYTAVRYDRNYYKKHPEFKDVLEEYISNSSSHKMAGKNNPAFGITFSKERTEQHSLVMKECQGRKEVKNKRSRALKEFYEKNPDAREAARVRQSLRQESIRLEKYGEKIYNKCIFCGNVVPTYMKLNKQYCSSKSCKGKWCNYKSKLNGNIPFKHSSETKNKLMSNLLRRHGENLFEIYSNINHELILEYKKNYCRSKSRFSVNSIKKYYGTIDNYIIKVKEDQIENK